jgi:sugar phosphate isomerase/epimerase
MSSEKVSETGRRDFFKTAGAGLAAAAALSASAQGTNRPLTEKEKLSRIASCCWPPRQIFKRRGGASDNPEVIAMRRKYGEITMHDFPQWTKDTYPGVYQMDLWSDVFGDPAEDSQYTATTFTRGDQTRTMYRWDPSTPSSKRWLDELANIQVKTGTRCCHISNNAPQNIADPDEELRSEGVRVAKIWMDASAVLGAKTMRINTGVSGTRVMPEASAQQSGYPRNDQIVVYLDQCIKSFRELAEYGEKVGVIISIENHWGLCANPMNIKIVIDEVNHPYCEATPDFCNWEHEYHLFHGLEVLMPYTHHHIHAKYWDRWKTDEKDWNDVGRSVRILNAHKFRGTIALEYEQGPWDGIEGSKWLMREVMAAL